MDIDTALWIIGAAAIVFIGVGCVATNGKTASRPESGDGNAGLATKKAD